MLEKAKDRPFIVTAIAGVITLAHMLLTAKELIPDIWKHALDPNDDSLALYLGLSGGAAILAGFAGVVVIYGLSVDTPRFREYRVKAGKRLVANWASISTAGFLAAGLALVAGILSFGPSAWLAPWLFEFAFLCAIHGTVRLLWLLRVLFKLKRDDDSDIHHAASKVPVEDLFK